MGRHLSQLARAADSLCDGDLVDRCIRSNMSWNLLPTAVSNRETINDSVKCYHPADYKYR